MSTNDDYLGGLPSVAVQPNKGAATPPPKKLMTPIDILRRSGFALPDVRQRSRAGSFVLHPGGRIISSDAYAKRSSVIGEMSPFLRYFLRALHRTQQVHNELGEQMMRVCREAYAAVGDVKRGRNVLAYLHGRGNFDAVFGDLVRLLVSKAAKQDPAVSTAGAKFVSSLLGTPEFAELRSVCHGDYAVASTTALMLLNAQGTAKAMGAAVADEVKTQPPPQQEPPQDGEEGDEGESGDGGGGAGDDQDTDDQDTDDQDGDGSGDSEGGDNGNGSDAASGAGGSSTQSDSPQSRQQRSEAAKAIVNEVLNSNKFEQMRGEVEESKSDGGTPMQNLAACLAAGNTSTGSFDYSQQAADEAVKLCKQYFLMRTIPKRTKQFAEFFDLLGRVDGLFAQAVSDTRTGDGDVLNIVPGNNPANVIPSELAMLCDEALEMVFYKRLSDNMLLENERQGVTDCGQGPVVVLLDMSGSMRDVVRFEGEKQSLHVVAKAFSLALAKHAVQFDRDVLIVPFNTDVITRHVIRRSQTNRKTPSEFRRELEALLRYVPNGCDGTHFHTPLYYAFDAIGKGDEFAKADIVFFSDGSPYGIQQDEVNRLLALKAKTPSRVFGLFINSYGEYAPDEGLEREEGFMEYGVGQAFDACVFSSMKDIGNGVKRLFQAIIKGEYADYQESW